ncbi:MAG TPA: hypothetical protein VMQ61_04095 [Thermoanaerobaculia bacterium]|nr:hypothetical protein [Thermoanaerobaculia bacterium]
MRHTDVLTNSSNRRRRVSLLAAAAAIAATFGCTQIAADDVARQQAHAMGKYKVTVTTEREKVYGTCTFVRNIDPDFQPAFVPTEAQLPDFLREEAVLSGADTVVMTGRIGEAYICGPGPLNPDGTLKTIPPPGH